MHQLGSLLSTFPLFLSRASTRRRRPSDAARRPCPALRGEALEPRCLLAGDVILEWNQVLLEANANDHALAEPDQGGPVLTARAFAMVSAAMYDAYNSVEQIGVPYSVSMPGSVNADSQAAVARAAHDMLAALFPAQQAMFASRLADSLGRTAGGPPVEWGQTVGAYVAAHLLAKRADDGTDFLHMSYTPSGGMGFHDVDPMNPEQGFYAPGAMDIAPFAMSAVSHFAARGLDDGTPLGRAAFLQSQEYAEAYQEVVRLGGDGLTTPTERTAEQTTIGRFWAYDGRPGLGTPPRLYNQIVREIAQQQQNTEAENARLFALVNLAMADAGVASWNTKYDDALWRPVLAIRNGEFDGNLDTAGVADWTPLGAPASNPAAGEIDFTPPFPAYTSGHATFGAAAFKTLENFYGRDDISFSFVSDEFNGETLDSTGVPRPRVERSFESFTAAKQENAQSRIYLGIHWSFDATEGIRQGDAVADYVFANVLDEPYTWTTDDCPWHNAAMPTDVDHADGTTLNDALLIVSRLRSQESPAVALSPAWPGNQPPPYYDVSADNMITLNDALQVVAWLRNEYRAGAGEAAAQIDLEASRRVPADSASHGAGETFANGPAEPPTARDEALLALLSEFAAPVADAASV